MLTSAHVNAALPAQDLDRRGHAVLGGLEDVVEGVVSHEL